MALAASYRHMSGFTPTRPDHDTATLYDLVISALGDAVEAIDRDEIEGRCRAVYRATDAITTLYLRLDVKQFGELTDDLADLYGHILGCLVGINFYNDPRIAQDAIELLHSLKEKRSAAIGMVSACVPANAPTHVIDGTRPTQNT
ncbi:MAG: flagellar protein FliS [Alphaproteobacteria bacterium]|nr:flagellar protein FliS [Alphaproteobacteria bacterium]